eukprot:SAG31_NODE_3349_length_4375_cov_7.496024_2_plen_885_part_00
MLAPFTWTAALALTTAAAPAVAAAELPPYIFWATDDVRPGETVMVAGWPFTNQSRVLLDGTAIPVTGFSANAIMATLPSSVAPGHHSIVVVDSAGRPSNSLALNAVDVWWCIGDGSSGVQVAAGGHVRCFGRGLSDDAGNGATDVQNLRESLAQLTAKPDLTAADVYGLLAARTATLPESSVRFPVLRLTPSTPSGHPVDISADPQGLTRNSATFTIPANSAIGSYSVTVVRGDHESKLQMFLDPARPMVTKLQVIPAAPTTAQKDRFSVTDFGPTGLNHTQGSKTDPNKWNAKAINATLPLLSAIKAAATAAVHTRRPQNVFFPVGVYHIDGPVIIPDGVSLVGEGSDISAVYFSYDNASTAPFALIAPDLPSASWGVHNMTFYVLSMYKNFLWVPGVNASTPAQEGKFHMSGVVIRASAFHCRTSVTADIDPHRSSPWWPGPVNDTYGGQHFSGYQPAILRLGALLELPSKTANPPSTRTPGLPARNVIVENCDIYGSWHLFQGRVQHATFRSNTLWNGMMCFYLEALETTIEHNICSGSSETAGGNGLNFAQHVYFHNNTVLHVRNNDREVMTYDAEGVQFFGTPSALNRTLLRAPHCPGILGARFELPKSEAVGTLPVSNPRGGMVLILDGPGAGQYRRVVDWGAAGDVDSEPCWWQLNRPFGGSFSEADVAQMQIAVTFFQGESIFTNNRFEDTGHFQLYHSSVSNVISGHSLSRMEGMWSAGMASSMRSAKNNSLIAEGPHSSFRNEFVDNRVRVGHRAPHQPNVQNRDTFWTQQIAHDMNSFGISGQDGTAKANRFLTFRRNHITGGNGIGIWGLGNGDVLVEGNKFEHVKQLITYDFFPDDLAHPTVQNVVVRENTPALGPAPAPPTSYITTIKLR